MAALKAVLFDVDDTLFDRHRAQIEIVSHIMRDLRDAFAGFDEGTVVEAFLDSDYVTAAAFGPDFPSELIRQERSEAFLKILGLGGAYADRVTGLYINLYPAIDAPVEGARSVVEKLASRYHLGVVSNGLPDVQYRKLETLGIRHLFECVVLSGELGVWKPDPRIFWRAMTLLKQRPGECLYVGDSYRADVVGAKRAGMCVCWFNPHGAPRPAQAEVGPDFEIHALAELGHILND
jgi:putative hydrolase of the HAD superfamily